MHQKPTSATALTKTPTYGLILNTSLLNELQKVHRIESDTDLADVIGVNRATLRRAREHLTLPSNEFMTKVRLAFPAVTGDQLFTIVRTN